MIFHDAVHASTEYSAAQKDAWAPAPPDLAAWAARFERTTPWIALRDNTPVGFIEWHPCSYIDCCYVAPAYQRSGIATYMVQWIEVRARCAGVTALHVDASLGAHTFFKRLGFKTLRRCHPVRSGVVLRNFVMRKALVSR